MCDYHRVCDVICRGKAIETIAASMTLRPLLALIVAGFRCTGGVVSYRVPVTLQRAQLSNTPGFHGPRLAGPPVACQERRQRRWDTAACTLQNSVAERRRHDHRAHLASLVGLVLGKDGRTAEVIVAMQPDKGGRKMLFLDAVDGQTLGIIELETLSAESVKVAAVSDGGSSTSVLRGMLVARHSRGKGYARLFLAIWLGLCARAGVTPATSRINKPLLALTLVRLGFTPLRGRDRPGLRGKLGRSRKAHQQPLAVEVSVGSEGAVHLYCSTSPLMERLRAGFSAMELRSQRLVLTSDPPWPRGRVAHIRVRYAPPRQQRRRPAAAEAPCGHPTQARPQAQGQLVHAPLAEAMVGGRLRLSPAHGPIEAEAHAACPKADVLRWLTGSLLKSGTGSRGAMAAATMSAVEATNASSSNTSLRQPMAEARVDGQSVRSRRLAPPRSPSARRMSNLFRPDTLGRGSRLDGGGTEGTTW
jgi:GNAT superfamily N-acetyltransferase